MVFKIRNADGNELDVAPHMFTDVYQHQGYERVDELANMTRDELNAHATSIGIADSAGYANKAELIEAIDTFDPEVVVVEVDELTPDDGEPTPEDATAL